MYFLLFSFDVQKLSAKKSDKKEGEKAKMREEEGKRGGRREGEGDRDTEITKFV
jgi:hypothetical protein